MNPPRSGHPLWETVFWSFFLWPLKRGTTVCDDIESIVKQLNDQGVSIEGSAEDYVNADDNLAVTGTLTDADIVASIRGDMMEESLALI